MAKKPRTATRSYTLGLLAPSDASDWLALWKRVFRTHYATCRGAREYGEFYLNLRGGLSPCVAACLDEVDEDRRRLLRRGARRMLALGWLSVESVRGAENHRHRVREVGPGQSLTRELAEQLLRDILRTHKGVSQEADLADWVGDCTLAATANIRPDAVIVNRAAAFAEWQHGVEGGGPEMPEQARRILFAMCGDGFASLTLPEEDTVKQDDELADSAPSDVDDSDEYAAKSKAEADEVAEPSKASRGVYCDLFGGDPGPKIKREGEKIRFAALLYEFLSPFATGKHVCLFFDRSNLSLGETASRCDPAQPLYSQLREWRERHGWDQKGADLLPREASPDNKKNKIAMPYRKLLVAAGLWSQSSEEGGEITLQHEKAGNGLRKKLNEVAITTDESAGTLGLVKGILNACAKRVTHEDLRVFKPAWAKGIQDSFERTTRFGAIKGAPEFRYLMFALAARRISQTQTWTKRNETERHKAAVKEDAAKKELEELDPDRSARAWFVAYEKRRGEDAQASSGFRITRRMIGECETVFKAWQGTESADERENETASLQAKAEKFGDAKLYTDLSEDPAATGIWRHEQAAEILKQWVKLRQAQHDQQRLKIPRFCHPDPFHHPTWCEFGGSSKPKVWYAWKPDTKPQNPEPGGNADGSRRLWMLLPDFEAKHAKPVPMRWRNKRLSNDLGGLCGVVEESIPRADRLTKAAANLPLTDTNQQRIRYRPAHPFTKDARGWNARLQLDRDTLERLERCWDAERREWRDEGKALRNARWFITFAPALALSDGPGRSIHPKLGWESSPHSELNKKQKREGHAKLILARLPGLRILSVDLGHRFAASCAVWEAISADAMKREIGERTISAGGMGKDYLYCHVKTPTDKVIKNGRNKGMPVTEVTIYRRIGENFVRDPKTGKTTDTPHPAPWARLDRQFFIKLQGEERPARMASEQDRPGHGNSRNGREERPARMASEQEYEHVKQLEDSLHYARSEKNQLPRQVDALMSEAVRTARLALRRHGDAARLAFGFASDYKPLPGARKFWFNKPQDDDSEPLKEAEKKAADRDANHTEYLQDLLCLWYDLAVSARWRDDDALNRWNTLVRPLIQQALFTEPPPLQGDDAKDRKKSERRRKRIERWQQVWEQLRGDLARRSEGQEESTDRSELKADREAIRALLAPVAEVLRPDRKLRGNLADQWKRRWDEGEKHWPILLKRLRRWLLPRGLRARPGETQEQTTARKARRGAAMSVGGLSFARLATLTEFRRQVQVGYFTRLHPDGSKAEIKEEFGQRILDAVDRMRAQRVKQIASRIVEAALGVGSENPQHWERSRRRPTGLLEHHPKGGARFKTCHAVVIENLRKYEFADTQPRRENRALMRWSAGKVRKYLEESCQLHGLHLREVMPNHTSRQCSRTGLPGVRCVDVFVDTNTGEPKAGWWKKTLRAARKTIGGRDQNEKKGDAESQFIVDLARHLADLKASGRSLPKTVRVPRRGGDLFVAAPPDSAATSDTRAIFDRAATVRERSSTALQADLNAAANIGLRALLDPDFPGKWWYIPVSMDSDGWRVPAPKSCAGAACLVGWKVAPRDDYLAADGRPLTVADDETVKQAEEAVNAAKKELDAARKAARNGDVDQASLDAAKERHEKAKAAMKGAKKAPSQKELVNIWQDPCVERAAPASGPWRETTSYWKNVKARVLDRLRAVNGLDEQKRHEPVVRDDPPW